MSVKKKKRFAQEVIKNKFSKYTCASISPKMFQAKAKKFK